MSRKKLMLLGGIRYLLPVIEAAHKLDAYVITADYLPDNIAHKHSDEYVNVSIIDREAVLKAAQTLKIDGIMSFGVDPGVVTAAYVADRMGLTYPPLASCEILQNKDRFRDFLSANGFNCPFHKGYEDKATAIGDAHSLVYPIIVKPVDSAGSKGVSRVDSVDGLADAVDRALEESRSGRFIIEQFLENVGCSSDTDCFSIDDELVFASFNCQYFDTTSPNPYTPAAFTWPSNMPQDAQKELRVELQRLMKLLNIGSWIYNVETRIASDGKPYIMEVSPRGGGNRLSEVLRMATGQDLIDNNVRAALRMPLVSMSEPVYNGAWAEVIVHSNQTGTYQGLQIADRIKPYVVQEDMWVQKGDHVKAFTGANQTIGTLVLCFPNHVEAEYAIGELGTWMNVKIA